MVQMQVIKRDGRREHVQFEKISARIASQCYGLNEEFIDPDELSKKVISAIYDGVCVRELDELAAETAAAMTTKHPDYALLASRIAVSSLHKETKDRFSDVVSDLYKNVDQETGELSPIVSDEFYKTVMENSARLNEAIAQERDYEYTYFGFKTLENSYLARQHKKVVERPQYMMMRAALAIHGDNIDAGIETYEIMSQKYFTHASPTLLNAGKVSPQLASCFLLGMQEDSVEGIYDTLKQCAILAKHRGGIGINVHNVRPKGSLIAGLGCNAGGIVPLLRVFNNMTRHMSNSIRKSPMAVYLEPWHPDVFEFLDLRKNVGKDEIRARDLFLALWVPDLFMKRVDVGGTWTLMDPNVCTGLDDCYGEEFEQLYTKYERENRGVRTVEARKLWFSILESQAETGMPYVTYKDACNRKSNQKNLGTIKSSNLCGEILEYTSKDEVAVCNLASLALNRFVEEDEDGRPVYNFHQLRQIAKMVTKNLDKVVDRSWYPLPEAQKSNMRHRPVGLGAQGLADTFILMRLPWDSDEARLLNIQIFETIYYGALEASVELATEFGTYETYEGSPASRGQLQYDLWGVTPTNLWDWNDLKLQIAEKGLRNSLLVALMPTASTAQIMGNTESFEPITSNMYTRRVGAGDFQVVNQYLVKDLIDLGLWDEDMRNEIMAHNGSVQNIPRIPDDLKALYKTVWEIKQRVLVDMAADRGAFVDQSQSLNLYMTTPNFGKLTSMHFHAWQKGLKTGMYYLRSRPAADAIQFTVDMSKVGTTAGRRSPRSNTASTSTSRGGSPSPVSVSRQRELEEQAAMLCNLENKDECLMCSG
eukprot:Clim_evm15s245 gene=Clim_evmTU15s245